MALSTATPLAQVLSDIQNIARNAQSQAQSAKATLIAGNVDTIWVFNFLDQMQRFIAFLNARIGTAGLNAYATANIPGYAGTFTTDMTAVVNAATACISWVTTNFPKDSTNTYILAQTLNADGTRTLRQFTPTQTAGLQTAVQTMISAIS